MIVNWIGQLLGLGESSTTPGVLEPRLWSVSADEPSPLSSVVDSPDMLQMELERARRYERGLSVVVLSIERPGAAGNGSNGDGDALHSVKVAGPPQVVALLAAAGLRNMLRQSDVLCYQPTENRFVLALAESDAEQAEKALVRIRETFRERLELGVRAGIARFPDDALTLADLIDTAVRTTPVPATEEYGLRDTPTEDTPVDRNGKMTRRYGVGLVRGNGKRGLRRVAPTEVRDDE